MASVKRLIWLVVAVGVVLALVGVVEPAYVFAPLSGLLIYKVGIASLASFRHGASYIPDGPPRPVDPARERVVYHCGGCGAEVLLLVRGTAVAPRHCGERMTEHVEVERAAR
jgi:DNA-directed RNA polymerase subunit RPC12/RpoP